MPYIKPEKKKVLENYVVELADSVETKSELAECIYKLGIGYLQHHKINYQNISDCIASMNDSSAEFQRRIPEWEIPHIESETKSRGINLNELTERIEVKGDLTYCICKLGIEYLRRQGKSEENISNFLEAMDISAKNFRKNILNSYEDEKIKENGDII